MSLSINTNVAALTAHRNMIENDNAMSTSLERLSTGLRINKAADDASGMAIADSLRAQHMGISQAMRNANDAISIVQTADGALEESINIVNTIKTKSIQAASDGQTADTRAAIQADIDKLTEELDAIAKTTSYNGQQLLSGEFTNKDIQVGASANETATINIGSTESTKTGHVSTAQLEVEEEGEIQLVMTSAITGEEVELEAIDIQSNNDPKNGMGALADEINSQTSQTGISADAVVESQTSGAIREGETGSDFMINGVLIGSVTVEDNDNDAALVNAINDETSETGVVATMEPDGSMKLSSVDGRAINVTGDTGGVFSDDSGEDLSTIGYINLTQEGSSQFNIQGTTTTATGDTITLNADLETSDATVLAADSEIANGSELAAGTVIGGDAEVAEHVADILSDYELTAGSTLGAGSSISQGTVLGGTVTVGGNTEAGNEDTQDLNQDMTVAQNSTLAAGTVIGADTEVTTTFTVVDAGTGTTTTYNAGDTLVADVTLTSQVTLTDEMVLSENSRIAAGSTLEAGTVMGADFDNTGNTWDESVDFAGVAAGGATTGLGNIVLEGDTTSTVDGTLKAGSTVASGSTVVLATGADAVYSGPILVTTAGVIEAGDTVTADTEYELVGDQTITADLDTVQSGTADTELMAGTIIADGSTANAAIAAADAAVVTGTDAEIDQEMTLNAGSSLAQGSVMAAGSELGDATKVNGTGGATEIATTQETTLASGSTLATGSKIAEGSTLNNAVNVAQIDLEEEMNLEAGSTLATGTMFTAGTRVEQDMTLNTVADGSGTDINLTAGDILTEDLYYDTGNTDPLILSEEMILEAGSTVTAGSEIIVSTESSGDVSLSNQESITLADISVMTQEDAQIAIAVADAALKDLDQTRADLGSVQNQLTSTVANLSITKTNIQASESTIRDVDFAEETSNFARLQLLSQTSSYALSQANASSQAIMSLLQ